MSNVINKSVVIDMLNRSPFDQATKDILLPLIVRFGEEVTAVVVEHLDSAPPGTRIVTLAIFAHILSSMSKKYANIAVEEAMEGLAASVLGKFKENPDAQG